ncbi:hypothetical protein OIU78_021623 [Salix suchowensis]|nr:hypothetical protein OIU78_021623 [Salix suchowensis]
MIEMDKSKDVRPRASRFSRQHIKQSGHKLLSGLNGGDYVGVVVTRWRKEKKCEMGGGGEVSDKEEVQAPSAIIGVASTNNKRFKLPRKFLDDCDGVDHATVPRKLRSAMKKRNRESISPPFPDSKKPDHPNCGVEAPKRVGLKKSRLNVKQPSSDWSGNQSVCGPITKDEEEVVETLYSLAGMFAGNKEPKNGCKLDNTYLDACPSTLQEPTVKEDLNPISLPRIDEAAEKTFLDETSKVDCLNKPGTQERPYLPN